MQRTPSEHLVSTVAFEETSSQHVLSGVQRQLENAGVSVTFNCHAVASAMPEHASIAPKQVFDVQVCLSVLGCLAHLVAANMPFHSKMRQHMAFKQLMSELPKVFPKLLTKAY